MTPGGRFHTTSRGFRNVCRPTPASSVSGLPRTTRPPLTDRDQPLLHRHLRVISSRYDAYATRYRPINRYTLRSTGRTDPETGHRWRPRLARSPFNGRYFRFFFAAALRFLAVPVLPLQQRHRARRPLPADHHQRAGITSVLERAFLSQLSEVRVEEREWVRGEDYTAELEHVRRCSVSPGDRSRDSAWAVSARQGQQIVHRLGLPSPLTRGPDPVERPLCGRKACPMGARPSQGHPECPVWVRRAARSSLETIGDTMRHWRTDIERSMMLVTDPSSDRVGGGRSTVSCRG